MTDYSHRSKRHPGTRYGDMDTIVTSNTTPEAWHTTVELETYQTSALSRYTHQSSQMYYFSDLWSGTYLKGPIVTRYT